MDGLNEDSIKRVTAKNLEDFEVAQKIFKDKDEKLFEEKIYDPFKEKIYHKCCSFLKKEQEAEDATMEILLKIYQKLGQYQGASSLSTWIFSVTKNYCYDVLRKKEKEPMFVELVSSGPVSRVLDVEAIDQDEESLTLYLKLLEEEAKKINQKFTLHYLMSMSEGDFKRLLLKNPTSSLFLFIFNKIFKKTYDDIFKFFKENNINSFGTEGAIKMKISRWKNSLNDDFNKKTKN